MTLPSLLLVPGAWHCGLHFGPLIDQLEKEHGFRCFTIDLPSTEDPDAVNSIDADTETVRNAVINILDETVKPDDKVSGDLVVLMHSYGGVPGSNALEGLSKTQRAKEGKRGGVIGIAYMAAFLTDEGYSVATTLTGDAEDWLSVPWKAVEGRRCWPKNPAETFYHDLSDEEARRWAAKLKQQALETNVTPTKYAAWKHYPVGYLLTENDEALPAFLQKMLLEKAWKEETVLLEEKLDTGHSPFLKDPRKTASFISRFVERLQ